GTSTQRCDWHSHRWRDRQGRVFQLGHYRLANPITACCSANPDDQQKIGDEILRRFKVIFDYPSAIDPWNPIAILVSAFRMLKSSDHAISLQLPVPGACFLRTKNGSIGISTPYDCSRRDRVLSQAAVSIARVAPGTNARRPRRALRNRVPRPWEAPRVGRRQRRETH